MINEMFDCEFCNTGLSSKYRMQEHVKKCAVKKYLEDNADINLFVQCRKYQKKIVNYIIDEVFLNLDKDLIKLINENSLLKEEYKEKKVLEALELGNIQLLNFYKSIFDISTYFAKFYIKNYPTFHKNTKLFEWAEFNNLLDNIESKYDNFSFKNDNKLSPRSSKLSLNEINDNLEDLDVKSKKTFEGSLSIIEDDVLTTDPTINLENISKKYLDNKNLNKNLDHIREQLWGDSTGLDKKEFNSVERTLEAQLKTSNKNNITYNKNLFNKSYIENKEDVINNDLCYKVITENNYDEKLIKYCNIEVYHKICSIIVKSKGFNTSDLKTFNDYIFNFSDNKTIYNYLNRFDLDLKLKLKLSNIYLDLFTYNDSYNEDIENYLNKNIPKLQMENFHKLINDYLISVYKPIDDFKDIFNQNIYEIIVDFIKNISNNKSNNSSKIIKSSFIVLEKNITEEEKDELKLSIDNYIILYITRNNFKSSYYDIVVNDLNKHKVDNNSLAYKIIKLIPYLFKIDKKIDFYANQEKLDEIKKCIVDSKIYNKNELINILDKIKNLPDYYRYKNIFINKINLMTNKNLIEKIEYLFRNIFPNLDEVFKDCKDIDYCLNYGITKNLKDDDDDYCSYNDAYHFEKDDLKSILIDSRNNSLLECSEDISDCNLEVYGKVISYCELKEELNSELNNKDEYYNDETPIKISCNDTHYNSIIYKKLLQHFENNIIYSNNYNELLRKIDETNLIMKKDDPLYKEKEKELRFNILQFKINLQKYVSNILDENNRLRFYKSCIESLERLNIDKDTNSRFYRLLDNIPNFKNISQYIKEDEPKTLSIKGVTFRDNKDLKDIINLEIVGSSVK